MLECPAFAFNAVGVAPAIASDVMLVTRRSCCGRNPCGSSTRAFVHARSSASLKIDAGPVGAACVLVAEDALVVALEGGAVAVLGQLVG